MICNPAFVLRRIYGKSILMPIRRNSLGNDPILLNDVATTIWQSAETCPNQGALVNDISDLYGLAPDSAERDAVRAFIEQLESMTLIYE